VHDLAKGRLGIPGFGSLDRPVAGSSGSSGSKVRLSSPPQRHPLLQALGIESILERENQSGKKIEDLFYNDKSYIKWNRNFKGYSLQA